MHYKYCLSIEMRKKYNILGKAEGCDPAYDDNSTWNFGPSRFGGVAGVLRIFTIDFDF